MAAGSDEELSALSRVPGGPPTYTTHTSTESGGTLLSRVECASCREWAGDTDDHVMAAFFVELHQCTMTKKSLIVDLEDGVA